MYYLAVGSCAFPYDSTCLICGAPKTGQRNYFLRVLGIVNARAVLLLVSASMSCSEIVCGITVKSGSTPHTLGRKAIHYYSKGMWKGGLGYLE